MYQILWNSQIRKYPKVEGTNCPLAPRHWPEVWKDQGRTYLSFVTISIISFQTLFSPEYFLLSRWPSLATLLWKVFSPSLALSSGTKEQIKCDVGIVKSVERNIKPANSGTNFTRLNSSVQKSNLTWKILVRGVHSFFTGTFSRISRHNLWLSLIHRLSRVSRI